MLLVAFPTVFPRGHFKISGWAGKMICLPPPQLRGWGEAAAPPAPPSPSSAALVAGCRWLSGDHDGPIMSVCALCLCLYRYPCLYLCPCLYPCLSVCACAYVCQCVLYLGRSTIYRPMPFTRPLSILLKVCLRGFLEL